MVKRVVEASKPHVDRFVSKAISRKFLVWLVACGALFTGTLDGEQWVFLSSLYIGTEGVVNALMKWKHGV